ncbi:zinc-finger domain-containing protein [Rummeliibacillus pycnus]|uniref:zinc-finger domain-containing protein n=1 Tax=Rummeliibacillus pycnus TaxID=101070 RepID=UPI000C9B2580|nr:zinc-finger domain-containing protein [Rummeliibacillus pycnus]
MEQITIVKEIDELLQGYCEDCLAKKQMRKERGKAGAHKFCIESCTVGEQLQFLGQELLKVYTKS